MARWLSRGSLGWILLWSLVACTHRPDTPPPALAGPGLGEEERTRRYYEPPEGPAEPAEPEPLAPAERTPACTADPQILACITETMDGTPRRVALASARQTIAVAWTEAGNQWLPVPPEEALTAGVGLALYDPELRERRRAALPSAAPTTAVALVATPEGWAVASQVRATIALRWLDGALEPTGAGLTLPESAFPSAIATATGEVLVVRLAPRGPRRPVVATLAGREGTIRWETEVFSAVTEAEYGGEVALEDGSFLVSRRTPRGIAVRRIEADGRQGPLELVRDSTEYPALAWCGRSRAGWLLWTDFASARGSVRLAALDRDGVRNTDELVLGAMPEHFNHSRVLCTGDEVHDAAGAIVLLAGYTGGTGRSQRLDLLRVARHRPPTVASAVPILAATDGRLAYTPELARIDRDRVAVAWIAARPGHLPALALAVIAASDGAALEKRPSAQIAR